MRSPSIFLNVDVIQMNIRIMVFLNGIQPMVLAMPRHVTSNARLHNWS
jgi:hypothetical protein